MDESLLDEYRQLLEHSQNQLDTLIYELENISVQRLTTFPTELKFDAVPIIRRLKEAKKLTQESLFIHRKRKTKKQ